MAREAFRQGVPDSPRGGLHPDPYAHIPCVAGPFGSPWHRPCCETGWNRDACGTAEAMSTG
jgi:hypothetical protein